MHGRHPQGCWAAGSLAGMVLLVGSVMAARAEPPSICSAAAAAITEGRVVRTRVLGCYDANRPFTELPEEGAVLVGFDCGIGRFFNIETVYALRPIYQTAIGETAYGNHGPFVNRGLGPKKVIKTRVLRTVQVRAQPGYAVGGVTIRSGLNINGLSVRFMRIKGTSLDPKQAYTSAWVGDRTGGSEAYISGDGGLVIGIHGSQDDDHIQSFGLFYIEQPAAVAAAPLPPIERPVARPPRTRPVEQPPQLPPDRPVAEPEAEPPAPAEPPARAAEVAQPPVAAAAKKVAKSTPQPTTPSSDTGLEIPVVVFVGVAFPLFVVLWIISKREQAASRRRAVRVSRQGPAAVVVPPADSTAICERPRDKPERTAQPASTEALLSIPLVEPIAPEEAHPERPEARPRWPEEKPVARSPILLPPRQPDVKAPARSLPDVAANMGMVLCFALFTAVAPHFFPATGGISLERMLVAGVAAAVGRQAGWLIGKFIEELRQ